MAINQLTLYNEALLNCGHRFLASLTENQESRRLLDQVWATNGVRSCLEEGQWFFAMRTVQIDYDPGIKPDFGYNRAFQKPSDWVLTSSLCQDEFFTSPLLRYVDEAGYWYSELDTLYVRYVSNDINYGMNFGLWPDSFFQFVAAHFASRIIESISKSSDKVKQIMQLREMKKRLAKSRSAMTEATVFPARGSWSMARSRGRIANNDGGSADRLIG